MCQSIAEGGHRCGKDSPNYRACQQRASVVWRRSKRYGVDSKTIRKLDDDFIYGSTEERVEFVKSTPDALTLEVAAADPSEFVRDAVFANPNMEPEALAEAAENGSFTARMNVASNPSTPTAVVEDLARNSTFTKMRLAAMENLAERGAVPAHAWATDPNREVRVWAAENLKAGGDGVVDARKALLADRTPAVRIAMLKRGGNLPLSLAKDPKAEVRLTAAQTSKQPDLLARLAVDKDPNVATAARNNPAFKVPAKKAEPYQQSKGFKQLSREEIGAVCAEQFPPPSDIRDAYFSTKSAETRLLLGARKDSPSDIAILEFEKFDNRQRAMMTEYRVFEGPDDSVLKAAVKERNSKTILRALVDNKHTPEGIADAAFNRLKALEKATA